MLNNKTTLIITVIKINSPTYKLSNMKSSNMQRKQPNRKKQDPTMALTQDFSTSVVNATLIENVHLAAEKYK